MRTQRQVDRLVAAYTAGKTKKTSMIAGGYSPRSASANACKVLPRQNQRHILFAQALFVCRWNKTAAARSAGYTGAWVKTNTARLMRYPSVQGEILRIRQRLFPGSFPPLALSRS